MPHIHELYDFTVSFYILHPTEKKLCLHFHVKLDKWAQLGGHIELDEDPMESLERELLEEAGISKNEYTIVAADNYPKLTNTKTYPAPFSLVIYKYGDMAHKHIDLPYVVQSKTLELKPQSGESMQIDWFTLKQIRELHSQNQLQDSTLDMCEWIFKNYL
jgi:8-oxo-dGTP pyrophosphatase MutT (NUDIX family)